MQKLILFLVLLLSLSFYGCNQEISKPSNQITDNDIKDISDIEEVSAQKNYSQWVIEGDYAKYNIWDQEAMSDNEQVTDCVEVIQGDTGGGDLLSSLIVDDTVRSMVNLNIYTKDYLIDLESEIVRYTNKEYDSDFYAFKTCHLDTGMEILAGYLYPKNKNSKTTEDTKTGTKNVANDDFDDKPILIVKNNENIFAYENIKLLDNTATGAEVTPCNSKLEGENIRWRCFESMYRENNELKGSNIKYWLIPLDGSLPKENTEIVVTTPFAQKSLEEYFATRKQFVNSGMVKNPDELGFKELANVAVTCPDSLGTPCSGNLLVLSKDTIHSGSQEFYLAFTMGTGYTYFGPFTDDLQRIVDESKSIQSLKRSY